jgi:hypothetical protein
MNIFYLDNNPRKCAEMHLDKHVVKMILEYAQLLSTAHRVLDGEEYIGQSQSGRKATRWKLNDTLKDDVLYKATHINHPSAVWVRQSNNNYTWLFCLFQELLVEYTHRYGKHHSCERLVYFLRLPPNNIPIGYWTQPTPAMPDIYKVHSNSRESYRNYYLGAKKDMAKWKNRNPPDWWNTNVA